MDKYKDTAITILSSVAALAVVSLPVWFMWNWLIPTIFGLPYIDYLEAWGLMAFVILINSILGTSFKGNRD
jgi:hypothetical protein